MQAVDFAGANFTFTRPKNMTDEQCNALRVYRGFETIEGENFPVIVSAWQPTAADIERINAGQPIYLQVVSNGMPPVCLCTEYNFPPPIQVTENTVHAVIDSLGGVSFGQLLTLIQAAQAHPENAKFTHVRTDNGSVHGDKEQEQSGIIDWAIFMTMKVKVGNLEF